MLNSFVLLVQEENYTLLKIDYSMTYVYLHLMKNIQILNLNPY